MYEYLSNTCVKVILSPVQSQHFKFKIFYNCIVDLSLSDHKVLQT